MLAQVPLCTVMCKIIRVTLNFCIFEQLCTLYFNKFVSIHFSQYLKLSLFLKKLLLKISSKFHRIFSNLKKNPPATTTDASIFLEEEAKDQLIRFSLLMNTKEGLGHIYGDELPVNVCMTSPNNFYVWVNFQSMH